jgi:hypothetical protein
MHREYWLFTVIAILTALGLSACGPAATPEPTITPVDEAAIQTAAVETFVAEITASAPTQTPLPSPTATLVPTPTLEPTLTPTATLSDDAFYKVLDSNQANQLLPNYIAFYLVFPLDPESCSYSMRPVLPQPYPERTGDVVADVTTALNLLFKFNFSNLGVFTNPLLPANHKLVSITVTGGSMAVYLTGDPARTDDPCINHQMRDQIFTTIRQIAKDYGINDIVPYLDSHLYDDYMIGE